MARGNPNPSPATRFKPGNSGNTHGKTSAQVKKERAAAIAAADLRAAMISAMQERIREGVNPLDLLTPEALRLFKDSEDRAFGTAKQSTEVTGPGGAPLVNRIIIEAAHGDGDDPPAA